MKQKLPTRRMREKPDLEQLKRQAKELLRGFAAGEPAAVAEVNAHYTGADPARFALHDAQLAIARSYGFDSWAKLKAFVDGVTVRRLAGAIRADNLPAVRAMLKARPELADLTMSYGDEHRPIHFAVMKRSPSMVRLLMRHGADARAGIHPHREATQAWTLAHERGYDEIAAIIEAEEARRAPLAETEPEPEKAPAGDELARRAAAAGDIAWLRERHEQGGFTNPVRWDGGGLLTVAVRNNQIESLRLLLDFGFDPDERVSIGDGDWLAYSQGFPLWQCAAQGREEMAELLLQRGADPNVHVDSSGSAVYSAFSHRQWRMVDLLRRHGGVVTADTAALYRQTERAREILAGPGPVDVQELLRFAACGGGAEIVRMALERIDWPPDDTRWFRCLTEPLTFWHHIPWLYAGNKEFDRAGYLACFQLILERCDANVTGGFDRTPLHEAAAMGDWVTGEEAAEFARALLDAGAKMDRRDSILQSTPLGWACRWGRRETVTVLLERGADPVERDAEPWARPRAWAEKLGQAEILQVLARHGG